MTKKLITEQEFRDAAKAGDTPDGQIRKAFIAEVKAVEGGDRKIDFVISTDSVDRMGDTIAVDGWQLGNYRKNPVVLWAHDCDEMPVAKASNIRVEDGKLKATAEFMGADISEFADSVFKAIKGGYLSAVSVGFVPVKYTFSEETGRTFGIDFLEQELLEFSVVPVPANAEALVEARAAGIDTSPIREWAAKVFDAEGLALIGKDRLGAVRALADEFRSDAKKAAGAKGASGIYRRCANRIEKALNGGAEEPETTADAPLPEAPETTAPEAPVTLSYEMARRRLALLG